LKGIPKFFKACIGASIPLQSVPTRIGFIYIK